MDKPVVIGGYFEFPLEHLNNCPHQGLYFNLGRSALEYALREKQIKRSGCLSIIARR